MENSIKDARRIITATFIEYNKAKTPSGLKQFWMQQDLILLRKIMRSPKSMYYPVQVNIVGLLKISNIIDSYNTKLVKVNLVQWRSSV